jgi:hypothetical protein
MDARLQPAHQAGGTLPVEDISEPSSGRALSSMSSLGHRRLRGDLIEGQGVPLSKIGQCEACFAPTNECSGESTLIEATRKVMPQR